MQVEQVLREAEAAASEGCRMLSSRAHGRRRATPDAVAWAGRSRLVEDVGVEDPEHPLQDIASVARRDPERGRRGRRGDALLPGARRLQRRLCAITDQAAVLDAIDAALQDPSPAGRRRARRLCDLASPKVDNGWLWAINVAHGPVLPQRDYLVNLRLRLGIRVGPDFEGTLPCGGCGGPISADEFDAHALSCAKGERTTGHNEVRDEWARLAEMADGRGNVKIEQLVPTDDPDIEGLRPADVLLSAAPLGGCGMCALDPGITSPYTAAAIASDTHVAIDSYYRRKLRTNLEPCKAAGWEYRACVMSAFGRRHDVADTTARLLARAAVRRNAAAGGSATWVLAGFWRRVGTLLARRNAAMIARCRPEGQSGSDAGTLLLRSGIDDDLLELGAGGGAAAAGGAAGRRRAATALVGGAWAAIGMGSDSSDDEAGGH